MSEHTEAEEVWAIFRLGHPELYSEEFRASESWPYIHPEGVSRA